MTTSTRGARPARRNAAVFAATSAVVVVLMLYPTSTNSATSPRRPGQALAPAGVVGGPTGGGQAPAGATRTVNGRSVDTQYGPVQVQLTVRAGRLVTATAIDYPQGSGRDQQINGYAVPILQAETVTAQNARIDAVSGATYTSDGYLQSLQSALDAAHLG